jgi:hypothetical protein
MDDIDKRQNDLQKQQQQNRKQDSIIFHIDIGEIPADRAEEFMDRLKMQFQIVRSKTSELG